MTITPEGLQDLDLIAMEEYRDSWQQLARDIDSVSEDVDKVRKKTISEEHFDGTAANVARTELKMTSTDFDQAQEQASGFANLIDIAVEELRTCKTELNRFLNEIHSLGFKVETQNGKTSIVSTDTVPDQPSLTVVSLHHDLRGVLDRAQSAQDDLQAAIADTVGTPSTWRPGPSDLNDGFVEEQLEAMIEAGASPESINQWWEGLSQEQQDDLMDTNPGLLGSTDGIPSDIRDTANRTTLDSDIDKLQDELDQINLELGYDPESGNPPVGAGDLLFQGEEDERKLWARREEAQAELDSLMNLRDNVGPSAEDIEANPEKYDEENHPPRYLLNYDTEGVGGAAVAVGNPDEADNTAVFVPGTDSTLDSFGGQLNRAQAMWNDSFLADEDADTSVITWLDYQSPQGIIEPIGDSSAEQATDNLSGFVQGLNATHPEDDGANTTLIGHSYGSRAIGETAVEHDLDIDSIISVGSPGMGVEHASELGIGADNVWSTTAENDPISLVPELDIAHGSDPVGDTFGGNVFLSDPDGGHSGYWDDGNVARRNMGLIITGQDHLVET